MFLLGKIKHTKDKQTNTKQTNKQQPSQIKEIQTHNKQIKKHKNKNQLIWISLQFCWQNVLVRKKQST
jgi:hypothetical protein